LPDTHLGTAFPNPLEPPTGCTFHPRCPHAMQVCSQDAPSPRTIAGGSVRCHLYDAESAEMPGGASAQVTTC